MTAARAMGVLVTVLSVGCTTLPAVNRDFPCAGSLAAYCFAQKPPWIQGLERTRTVMDKDRGHQVLEVSYPKGKLGEESGAQWIAYLHSPRQRATVSYWVKFAPGFEFVLGGKLPGLIGGHKEGQAHWPVGGGIQPTGKNGWSARLMWVEEGRLVQYVYHMDQKGKYGDMFDWKIDERIVKIQPGVWHHLVSEVTVNDIGQANGRIRSWFDGKLALDATNLRFRSGPGLEVSGAYFSTFFGGEDPEWVAERDEWVRFDGFEVMQWE